MKYKTPNQAITSRVFDEGTSSPFPARLMLQMFHLRDHLLRDPLEYKKFDSEYSVLLDNFIEFKLALKNLKKLFERHGNEVKNGSAIKIHPNGQLAIKKPIDNEYSSFVKDFFIKGEIVISSIPRIGEVFGLKVGFFFASGKKFNNDSLKLKKDWGDNAELILKYIKTIRSSWYKNFNDFRNDIEHKSTKFPPLSYKLEDDGNIKILYPEFSSGGLVEILENLEYSVLELVERCLIFFFSTKLMMGIFIREIPPEERDPKKVIRYKLYMRIGNQDVPYGSSI